MATVVIGDIHGNSRCLNDLLSRIAPGLTGTDTVVFLGDYIDRGPDSKGCIDAILGFQDSTPARVVPLLGNHEDWLQQTLEDYSRHSWLLGMEAFETINSYSPEAAATLRQAAEDAGLRLVTERVSLPYEVFVREIPERHLAFLTSLQLSHRTGDAFCAHGGIAPDGPAAQQRHALIWGTQSFLEDYSGPELVVYGHWDNADMNADGWPRPAMRPASIGLDTISHGVLTAVRLPEREVVQSARFRASRGARPAGGIAGDATC